MIHESRYGCGYPYLDYYPSNIHIMDEVEKIEVTEEQPEVAAAENVSASEGDEDTTPESPVAEEEASQPE